MMIRENGGNSFRESRLQVVVIRLFRLCAEQYDIDEIIIAMPSISRSQISSILDISVKKTNCKLRSLPGMYQLVNGEVSVSKLRDVEVEDLLGKRSD